MKKFFVIAGGGIFLLLLAGLLIWDFGVSRYPPQEKVLESLNSPDQSLLLTTRVNHNKSDLSRYLCVIVDIRESNEAGKIIHSEITPASARMRWSIKWEGNDRIILDSSDVGEVIIYRNEGGLWESRFR